MTKSGNDVVIDRITINGPNRPPHEQSISNYMLKWKRHNKSFRSFTQTSIDEEN